MNVQFDTSRILQNEKSRPNDCQNNDSPSRLEEYMFLIYIVFLTPYRFQKINKYLILIFYC